MSKIGRILKKIAYSKATPDLLFDWYFNLKNSRGKNRLLKTLEGRADLTHLIDERTIEHWMPRIKTVMLSSDNDSIPRHPDAGQILNGKLVMHNGIEVEPLGYYSFGMLKMLKDNKGVHEPQEEKIFQEVLNSLPSNKSMTMLELGAYWSFYSMWFLKQFRGAQCLMVEPDRMNLFYGKSNFKLNNLKGKFVHAGIGNVVNKTERITTVDEICEQKGIDFIDILHSDIQGFELEMLEGSKKMLSEKKVGYAFISTHSNELHKQCYELLKNTYGFILVASADLDESYSWDGVLVMKMPGYPGIDTIAISKRS